MRALLAVFLILSAAPAAFAERPPPGNWVVKVAQPKPVSHQPLPQIARWATCSVRYQACRLRCAGAPTLASLGACAGRNKCWRTYQRCRSAR